MGNLRSWTVLLISAAAVGATLAGPGCRRDSGTDWGRSIETLVVGDNGEPVASAVGMQLGASRAYGTTGLGRLQVDHLPQGPMAIRIGDSIRHPALLYRTALAGYGIFPLDRAVFLPDLATADSVALDPLPAADVTLTSAGLPGFLLTVSAGTAVGFPPGLSGILQVGVVAPDRLPEPLPPGRASRAAYVLEPFGTSFGPPATLELPNVDGLPAGGVGAAELWRVDPGSGAWEMVGPLDVNLTGTALVDPGGGGNLTEATLVIALPKGTTPLGDVTGRIAAPGGIGTGEYPVLAPGSVGDVSGGSGGFLALGVPLGVGAIRVHGTSPGDLRNEAFSVGPISPTGSTTDVGDVPVQAAALDFVPPSFLSNPGADSENVDENITVVLTFNEPMDPARTSMELRGLQGTTAGSVLLSADGRTLKFEPDGPLLSFAKYYIVVDGISSDPSGNKVPENERVVSFITRLNPSPPPTSVSVIGLWPAEGRVGDLIDVVGRNFTGGTAVTVGGIPAQVIAEWADRIRFRIPPGLTAGSRTVSVSGSGSLTLSVLPTLDTLNPSFGDPGAGYPVVLSGTGLGTSAAISFHGTSPLLSSSKIAFGIAVDPATPSNLLLATGGGGVFRSADGGAAWLPSSPGITEGMVRTILIDPATSLRAYLGTLGGGVFLSIDGGQSWTPSNAGLGDLRVLCLAADISAPGVVLAGTLQGLYRSVDSGLTWTPSDSGILVRTILSLAQNPLAPGEWYAGSTGGSYRSLDGGLTWSRVSIESGRASVTALAVDPTAGTTVYEGTGSGKVYRSSDAGATWADRSVGLLGAPITAIAVDPGTPTTIYAATLGDGVQRSTDSALSWFPRGAAIAGKDVFALAIDPATPATIYAALEGSYLFKSVDGGGSWAASASGVSFTEERIVVIPDGSVPTGPVVAEVGGRRTNPLTFLARRWPDSTGPGVIAADPIDGDTAVPPGTSVQVVLSEPVTGNSTFTVADPSMIPVAGTFGVTVWDDRSAITFQPDAPLTGATLYTITVAGGVEDLSGNPLDQDPILPGDQDFTSTFSTP